MPKLSTSVKTLSWAAYLACSWTWCIGMFLPILVVRDYGAWGFVAFALPNVIGAAAMGFVLTRDQSRSLTKQHRPMIAMFSVITMTYHFFFLVWLRESQIFSVASDASGLARSAPILGAGVPILLVSSWFLLRPKSRRHHRIIASVTWLLSFLALFLNFAFEPRFERPPKEVFGLIGLAPVSLFGFLLCPYLDATFHRVRSATGRISGRMAFALGFGFFFAVMILLTLTYQDALIKMIYPDARFRHVHDFDFLPTTFHLILQATFTVIVHALMLRRLGYHRVFLLLPPALGLMAGVAASQFDTYSWLAMSSGEVMYRILLSFYGLIFPAYVYLCMIPTSDGHAGLTGPNGQRKRNTWLACVAIAAPLFWMGFIERRELFFIPGLAIILLARLTLPGGPGLPKRADKNRRSDGGPSPIAEGD